MKGRCADWHAQVRNCVSLDRDPIAGTYQPELLEIAGDRVSVFLVFDADGGEQVQRSQWRFDV